LVNQAFSEQDAITMQTILADFVVVGAGVFGAWIAHTLRRRGHSVVLVDAYGAGNSRSSSGDESRIIRMGYGRDRLYTRWSANSLQLWQELFHSTSQSLFIETGVLWLGSDTDVYTREIVDGLAAEGIAHEKLSAREIAARFPQIGLERVSFGVFEPASGVLLARRSVQAVVDDAVRSGVQFLVEGVVPPQRRARLDSLRTRSGQSISGSTFIFACGAWLPQMFPEILATRIFPTRQEVFYFGPPAGTSRFKNPAMPAWLHHEDEIYGLPDIENRGIKIASDRHGEPFDPESGDRLVAEQASQQMRAYLRCRLPELKDAPLLESRVCQYENTSNGDFLIDRHPEIGNAWLVGGGSGHGFKHGPAVGKYVTETILDASEPEMRFSMQSKLEVKQRAVF
jgi:sarcosine oxidase